MTRKKGKRRCTNCNRYCKGHSGPTGKRCQLDPIGLTHNLTSQDDDTSLLQHVATIPPGRDSGQQEVTDGATLAPRQGVSSLPNGSTAGAAGLSTLLQYAAGPPNHTVPSAINLPVHDHHLPSTHRGVSQQSDFMPISQDVGLAILEQLRLLNLNTAVSQSTPVPNSETTGPNPTMNNRTVYAAPEPNIHQHNTGVSNIPPNLHLPQLGATHNRYRPPGVPSKTLDQALKGEFVELSDFLPALGSNYTSAASELEPYLENNNTIHYRPKKHNRKVVNYDTWSEAWAEYEKFLVKSLGCDVHEAMSNYRSFMFEANRKYSWYALNIYDIKHRCKLASKYTLSERLSFNLADPELLPTILDSTAVKPNVPRCPRCRSFDHFIVKQCPFPESVSKTQAAPKQTATQTEICLNFNREKCVWGEKCRRKHICRLCKGPLPFNRCSISGPCRDKGKDAT